jgi:menaquinone-dependent protoporphyrinogen oxidase
MQKRILVAYATNSGSTGEVAEVVGAELTRDGAPVDVCRISDVTDVCPYGAVVVGAPMILGWHRDAVNFVRAHKEDLAKVPVAYFFTAMSLTHVPQTAGLNLPVFEDPALVKPPRNPSRLSLRENYATPAHYLSPVLGKGNPSPARVAFFAGRMDYRKLNILQMLFVMLVIGAQPGDYRSWPAIEGWAAGLREGWAVEAP